jgi:hypothetical protein
MAAEKCKTVIIKQSGEREMTGKFPVQESEDGAVMSEQTDSLWSLFETSGCIIYYLLYKMFAAQ